MFHTPPPLSQSPQSLPTAGNTKSTKKSRALIALIAAAGLALGAVIGGGAVVIAHETGDETREWAVAKYGTFDAFEISGSGNKSFDLPSGANAGMLTAVHNGTENFDIGTRHRNDPELVSNFFSTDGNYSGTSAYGVDYRSSSELVVEASGDWEITFEPISQAPFLQESGHGDAVFLYDGQASDYSVNFTGEEFSLAEEAEFPAPDNEPRGENDLELRRHELRQNGPADWTITGGPSVIMIKTDGDWSFERK